MAKLEILQVGAPVLREKCVKVETFRRHEANSRRSSGRGACGSAGR